jgi:hypothetical protein
MGLLLQACATFPSSKPKAASTLHCGQEQITIVENTTFSEVATGCGRSDVMVFEGKTGWSSLRERLTFELSCSDADIDIKILSPSTYGVTGCGKKILYKYVPQVGVVADTTQTSSETSTTPSSGQPGSAAK